MRITNKMLSNNYLSDMSTNLNKMRTLQQQLASGKNFRRASDDPFNVSRSMQMHSQINANKQYNKNITNVINWMDTTDTALGQVGNVFQSIREKMVSAENAAYGSDERAKIKDEINQRVGQIAQILNTSFDGEYIFGGTKGASKPLNSKEVYLPGKVEKSDSGSGDVTISGEFNVDKALGYIVKVADAAASPKKIIVSTDGGKNFQDATNVIGNTYDIGNGISITIDFNTNTSDGDTYSFNMNKETQLIYADKKGERMASDPAESEIVKDVEKLNGAKISFTVDGSVPYEIEIKDLAAGNKAGDLMEKINSAINSKPELKGKVTAEVTKDGRISFKALSDENGKDYNVVISDFQQGPDPSDIFKSSIKGKQIPSIQFDAMKGKRQTELSQGVLVEYNVSATEVMQYGTDSKDNISALLSRIVNHLNGVVEENGEYKSDPSTATKALTNEDLKDLDRAMAQILKVRSEVGAKQNRMESAKDQNEQSNLDMTDILSKTEDIDITEKTMEYAMMQTVYLASLQTSAKVLQPTLMDYMR